MEDAVAMPLTAVSLFSGIGGFELAAEANGIKILCQVEKDNTCRAFLNSHWPEIPQYDDIKTFPAERYKGATLIMGGPPCQAVSNAGKRRGKNDDRYLWDETIAITEIIKPTWCLFENVSGLATMGLDGILTDLEGIGYEVGTVEIPACAVDSPQLRKRLWILANSISSRSDGEAISVCREGQKEISLPSGTSQSDMADMQSSGRGKRNPDKRRVRERKGTEGKRQRLTNNTRSFWDQYIWTSCADGKLRRAPDDTQCMAHGLPVELLTELAEEIEEVFNDETGLIDMYQPKRTILAALGNSIVWPVAAQIIKAIVEADKGC
jgi:site-specific DNA-cytosine methylase